MRTRLGLAIYLFYSKIIHFLVGKEKTKELFELWFWKFKKLKESELTNVHYEYFFTSYFDLDKNYYHGKKILDIGCGPRGSLEWAKNASERIGLDPLADEYLKLGADCHGMKYINDNAESMPFPDNYFDVISSFNSLDHVNDLSSVIMEIKRVLVPGGIFLLITDIHEIPTICEPSSFSWDITSKFSDVFISEQEKHFEGNTLYKSIRKGIPYDHSNPEKRYGVLTVKMVKKK